MEIEDVVGVMIINVADSETDLRSKGFESLNLRETLSQHNKVWVCAEFSGPGSYTTSP